MKAIGISDNGNAAGWAHARPAGRTGEGNAAMIDGIYKRVGAIAQDVLWNTRNGPSRPASSHATTSFEEMVEQREQMQARARVEASFARRDAIQTAYAECRAQGMSDDEFFMRWDSDRLELRADLDTGAEIRRIDPDGVAVYGDEPDGVYLAGRVYEERFWVAEATDVDRAPRTYEFQGGLR